MPRGAHTWLLAVTRLTVWHMHQWMTAPFSTRHVTSKTQSKQRKNFQGTNVGTCRYMYVLIKQKCSTGLNLIRRGL